MNDNRASCRHRHVGSTKIRSSENRDLVNEVKRIKRLQALDNWEITVC